MRHAEFGRFLDQPIKPAAPDRRKQQPQRGFARRFAQPMLADQRHRAICAGADPAQPLAVRGVEGGDGGARTQPQNIAQVMRVRGVQRDFASHRQRRADIDPRAPLLGHVAPPPRLREIWAMRSASNMGPARDTPNRSSPGGGEGRGPATPAQPQEGAVRGDPSDIRTGDWVERYLPAPLRPYARLARLDRPIGTWLLLFPGWWGIALASPRWPDPVLLVLFALGALTMRGAGCTLNDIADREYDGMVARTRLRPLPSGRVGVAQAILFMVGLLAVGAAVLFSLNRLSIVLGVAVLGLIATYPLMKRITWWPQFFLGLNFNWGALIGWTAVTGQLASPPVLLYVGGILWTIGYDTIYAHQDKADDSRIGVKSSALALGRRTRPFLFAAYAVAVLLWGAAGAAAGLGVAFDAALAAAASQLLWQAAHVRSEERRV